jgi:hypothetical protein
MVSHCWDVNYIQISTPRNRTDWQKSHQSSITIPRQNLKIPKFMSSGMTRGSGGPRKYAHNVDAAREREMHLYDCLVLFFFFFFFLLIQVTHKLNTGTSRTGATRHQKSLLKNHAGIGPMRRATMFSQYSPNLQVCA